MSSKEGDIFTKIASDRPPVAPKSTPSSSSAKSSSKDPTEKLKDSKEASSLKNKNETSLTVLVDIMSKGFKNLQNLLTRDYEEYDDELVFGYDDDDVVLLPDKEKEIFEALVDDAKFGRTVGPDITPTLAALANKYLKEPMSESIAKEKIETYSDPEMLSLLRLQNWINPFGKMSTFLEELILCYKVYNKISFPLLYLYSK